ncbi:MAG: histidine phosphatase family protein [bacterium]|nr:histidine phosphatase family protein [bacterium]
MIDLYLFRHAECEMNKATDLIGGRSNSSELTSLGKSQAKLLGLRLAKEDLTFDHVYASPAKRTLGTAQIACEEVGFSHEKIIIDERIQELDQGDWEGKPRVECYTPETMKILEDMGWDFKSPNGESRKEVEDRMVKFVDENVLSKYDSKKKITVAVFSHGVAIKCLLRHVLDFDQAISYKVLLSNTSISQLRFTDKGWFVERINDGAHIADSDALKAYQNWVYGTIE